MTAQVREAAEKAIGQRGIVGDVYLECIHRGGR